MNNLSRRDFLGYAAAVAAGGVALGLGGQGAAAGATLLRRNEPEDVHAGNAGSLSVGMCANSPRSLSPFAIQGYQWSQMMGFVLSSTPSSR